MKKILSILSALLFLLIASSCGYYGEDEMVTAYSVTFDANGGTVGIRSQIVDAGVSITLPMPTRTGVFDFDGWYDSDGSFRGSGGNRFTVNSNITLTARWTQRFTITFDSQGGSNYSPQTVREGTQVALPTPTRTGYTFDGWFSGGARIGSGGHNYTVNSTITLFAEWTIRQFVITFNAGTGGTVEPTSLTRNFEQTVSLPTPTRTGHTFDGWFTSASGGTRINNPYTVSVNSERTLFAQWTINQHTVTFNANGGSVVSPPSMPQNFGATIQLPNATRVGHTFNGWFTATSGGEQVNTPLVITEDTTLFAQWTPIEYTIPFHLGLGTDDPTATVNPTSITGNFGDAVILPTPTRTGHTFNGWWTSMTGEGIRISPVESMSYTITENSDRTLYARWTVNMHIVTLNANGGRVSIDGGSTFSDSRQLTRAFGATANLPETISTINRTGYDFIGWFTEADGGELVESSHTIRSNLILFARWTIRQFTVNFAVNTTDPTATVNPTGTTDDFNTVITLPEPTREGHTFNGWWWTTSPTIWDTRVGNAGDNFTITRDTTLFAQWTINSYDVTLNANGGQVSTDNGWTFAATRTVSRTFGSSFTLPTPTRTGHTFNGWFTEENGGEQVESPLIVRENTMLFAQWALIQYTITFNLGAGAADPTATVNPTSITEDFGETVILPTPTRDGHTFTGWWTTQLSGGTRIDFGGNTSYTISTVSTRTLFARWTINSYNITLNANGGVVNLSDGWGNVSSGTTNRTFGNSFILPIPTRTGFDFNGWFTEEDGGTQVESPLIVSEITTLFAQWTPVFTTTFNLNPNPAPRNITVEMRSSWHSGWSSNALRISVNGTNRPNETLTSSSRTFAFDVNVGDLIQVNWVASGSWADEAAFAIYYTNEPPSPAFNPATGATNNIARLLIHRQYNGLTNTSASLGSFTVPGEPVPEPITANSGSPITLPPTPTRSGFTFDGWFTEAIGGELVGLGGNSFTPTATGTIFAQWTPED